jgi:hypothetical protein
MKKTQTLLLAVLGIALVFNSCKKSSHSPVSSPSMKLTYNGTALSFNSCLALSATVGSTDEVLITGDNVTGSNHSDNSFEVDIVHSITALKAGQTFPAATAFTQAESSTLFFFTNATDTFVSQPKNPYGTVTITGVTSTTITGTFSGTLYAVSDFSGLDLKYTITDGTFTAKIVK